MAVREIVEGFNYYLRRLLRLVTMLVDLHLEIALREASAEQKRLSSGFTLLAIGLGLVTMGMILLQAALVWMAHLAGLPWLGAICAIAVLDLTGAYLFLMAASRRLHGPYMPATRERVQRSLTILLQDED
ncbi:phage holin family protein [Trichothermofontia sp.]